jgi:hypothetical protein
MAPRSLTTQRLNLRLWQWGATAASGHASLKRRQSDFPDDAALATAQTALARGVRPYQRPFAELPAGDLGRRATNNTCKSTWRVVIIQ